MVIAALRRRIDESGDNPGIHSVSEPSAYSLTFPKQFGRALSLPLLPVPAECADRAGIDVTDWPAQPFGTIQHHPGRTTPAPGESELAAVTCPLEDNLFVKPHWSPPTQLGGGAAAAGTGRRPRQRAGAAQQQRGRRTHGTRQASGSYFRLSTNVGLRYAPGVARANCLRMESALKVAIVNACSARVSCLFTLSYSGTALAVAASIAAAISVDQLPPDPRAVELLDPGLHVRL